MLQIKVAMSKNLWGLTPVVIIPAFAFNAPWSDYFLAKIALVSGNAVGYGGTVDIQVPSFCQMPTICQTLESLY